MARKFKSMDGNEAAAWVSYAYTEVASIYPITPSSPMADHVDQWAAQGLKNIFGTPVKIQEMESEAGAAGAVHGSLGAGALTTSYTASQGLLLMIPNMYKMAGEGLPNVLHVSARTVATQALNIFGDHSDVMACRQTGYAMLAEGNVQEVMDLSPVAHLAAIEGGVPFLNFFDGFRTSHEIQKVAVWDFEDLKDMVDMDAVQAFRDHALNPEHPTARGSHENGDIFFQHREACNGAYNALPQIVQGYMDKINEKLGTSYHLFDYYGAPDADRVVVCMGSFCDTLEEVIDYLNAHGEKVGLVKVRLYRPWSVEDFAAALPDTVKSIAVLDRTKEPGSIGEPLYQDVITSLAEAGIEGLTVIGGRYGLGSKDEPPAAAFSVYEELKKDEPKREFTIGIVDDVTNLSLPMDPNAPGTAAPGTIECKFWGLGGDGTVGANKNSIKIIGDHTDKYVQAYFQYDSKKTGGVTVSHLRFGDSPIRSPYYVTKADFVACHNPSYIIKGFKMVRDVKPGGTFLVNCQWSDEEFAEHLPAEAKRYIAKNNVNVYLIDAIDLAEQVGMGKRTNTVLQSAFFALADILPAEEALQYMKDAATKSYSKKGDAVVAANHKAIDAGATAFRKFEVPADWADATDVPEEDDLKGREAIVKQVRELLGPINRMDGDSLPVSAFMDHVDGAFELGASAYEKRGTAVMVPRWNPELCIQCNNCAYVCPHAAIRPIVMDPEEAANAPEAMKTLDLKVPKGTGYTFTVAVSPLDCMGCYNCLSACPKSTQQDGGALTMVPQAEEAAQVPVWDYAVNEVSEKRELFSDKNTRGSQFSMPMLEFSGSCAGCAETGYARLVTQLFGDRMFISNATGCSSIWGNLAVHLQRRRSRPRVEQLPVRGQRRARHGSAHRLRGRAEPPRRPDREAPRGRGPARGSQGRRHRVAREPRHHRRLPAGFRRLRGRARQERQSHRRGRRRQQVLPVQEVLLDLRRRRLGLRHRLRRPRPRAGLRQERERLRLRHRGLLQHRRPGLQGLQPRPGGAVRRRGQGHQEEAARRDDDELRLRLRGPGGHGCQPLPAAQGPCRGRGLRRPVPHHRLQPLRDALHQEGRHAPLSGGAEARRGLRLLEPLPLQPRRPRRQAVHPRLQGAQGRLPGVPGEREPLRLAASLLP